MVMETAYICEFMGANQLYGTIQQMHKQNIEVMKQNKREIRKKDSNWKLLYNSSFFGI